MELPLQVIKIVASGLLHSMEPEMDGMQNKGAGWASVNVFSDEQPAASVMATV